MSGERVVLAMRFFVLYTLVTLALLGCSSPYPDDLPLPDLRDKVFIYLTGYENRRECIQSEQLLWESLVEDIPIEDAAMRSIFTQTEPGTCAPSASKIEGGALERGITHVLCCN